MPLAPDRQQHDDERQDDEAGIDAGMFERAPVSLWLEDFSRLKTRFDLWRAEGVSDLRGWLKAEPQRVAECMNCLRVIRVNQRTLQLFEARDTAQLVDNFAGIFRDATLDQHIDQLQQMWDGSQHITSSTVNYTLGGKR